LADNGEELRSTAEGMALTASTALCVGDNAAEYSSSTSDDENLLVTELATPKKAKTGRKGNRTKKSSVMTLPQRKRTMPAKGGA